MRVYACACMRERFSKEKPAKEKFSQMIAGILLTAACLFLSSTLA